VFKRPIKGAAKRNYPTPIEVRTCPSCGGDAYLVSSDFRAPRQNDLKAWEVAGYLVRAGLPYFRIYEDMPLSALGHPKARPKGILGWKVQVAPWPTTMDEARAFVEKHRDKAQPIIRPID
jgi:hypothetical protein